MNAQLLMDVTSALETNCSAEVQGGYLTKIECDSCGKREAFTSKAAPWLIQCSRLTKCGESHHIKDLFPHLFETWTERYAPKTESEKQKNPTAVADGYLKDGRGFDLIKITGWYKQEYYHDHQINAGTTTVRFQINENCFTERLLDKPQRFNKKTRTVGPYKGHVWVPDVYTLKDLSEAKEVWIVEGIFDAIALHHVGIIAVSNISAGVYPDIFLEALAKQCPQGKRPNLVWAQDSDKAGQKAIHKHTDKAIKSHWKCRAAQIPPTKGKNYDWNDLFQQNKLTDFHIELYLHEGDLLLAPTASEKALLMYQRREKREFNFVFESQLWWWRLDLTAYDKQVKTMGYEDTSSLTAEDRHQVLKSAGTVKKICTGLPTPLYFQENKVTGDCWFYFSVEQPESNLLLKNTFTPKQLGSVSEFKSRLLAMKGTLWTGKPSQLDYLIEDWTKNLKTVETIDYIGYSKEHKTYIYNDIAIKEGKVLNLNEHDYFQFRKLAIKTLSGSTTMEVNTQISEFDRLFAQYINTAFNESGCIALAWWLGSLFAEQIRTDYKNFPFLEIIGDAGAGKSTLIEFLWKTLGRDNEEGFDPCAASNAALNRKFAQVSNMPVSLIESDREEDNGKVKQFSWDSLKTLFNGRSISSRGVKNNGNETYEPPFRGTVLISQNAAVNGGTAILSRIVHLHLLCDSQTPVTRAAAEWLATVSLDKVSGFLLVATKKEKEILQHLNSHHEIYFNQIMQTGNVRMIRIAENHAKLMALADCLGSKVLKILDDDAVNNAKNFLIEMAVCRQNAINSDHPIVQDFWENFEFIASHSDVFINHTPNRDFISINLKEYEHWCNTFKIHGPDIRELKRYLKGSKRCKFIDANVNTRSEVAQKPNSSDSKQLRCWKFENPRR